MAFCNKIEGIFSKFDGSTKGVTKILEEVSEIMTVVLVAQALNIGISNSLLRRIGWAFPTRFGRGAGKQWWVGGCAIGCQ